MSLTMTCPKCSGTMSTHNRNGVHIEQCEKCRGIFLDYGEIETLTQLQNQWVQQMPAQPPGYQHGHAQPAWGAPPPQHPYPHYYKRRGLMGMLFSS